MLCPENELEESSQRMFSQIVLALVGFVVNILFNQAFFFFLIFPPVGKLIHNGRLLL